MANPNQQSNSNLEIYKKPEYLDFIHEIDALIKPAGKIISADQFLTMSRSALKLKEQIPELKAEIAYEMVGVGSALQKKDETNEIKEIYDLFADLELPDEHIVSSDARERGDFSEVQQKWNRIEELLATQGNDTK